MYKIVYIMLGSVLTFTILLIISCDDFLAPTIEIFNENKTIVNIEQDQKQEKKKESKQENINQF